MKSNSQFVQHLLLISVMVIGSFSINIFSTDGKTNSKKEIGYFLDKKIKILFGVNDSIKISINNS